MTKPGGGEEKCIAYCFLQTPIQSATFSLTGLPQKSKEVSASYKKAAKPWCVPSESVTAGSARGFLSVSTPTTACTLTLTS